MSFIPHEPVIGVDTMFDPSSEADENYNSIGELDIIGRVCYIGGVNSMSTMSTIDSILVLLMV